MRFILFAFLLLPSIPGFSQDFNRLKLLQYTDDVDYRVFENDMLECADYILSVPVSGDSNRDIAVQALIRWMRGTPDYVFELNRPILAMAKEDHDILDIYMAAMTKSILEHKEIADDPEEVAYRAFTVFLNYCANPGNKVPITRRIQKAIDAKNKNRLRSYLQP